MFKPNSSHLAEQPLAELLDELEALARKLHHGDVVVVPRRLLLTLRLVVQRVLLQVQRRGVAAGAVPAAVLHRERVSAAVVRPLLQRCGEPRLGRAARRKERRRRSVPRRVRRREDPAAADGVRYVTDVGNGVRRSVRVRQVVCFTNTRIH